MISIFKEMNKLLNHFQFIKYFQFLIKFLNNLKNLFDNSKIYLDILYIFKKIIKKLESLNL